MMPAKSKGNVKVSRESGVGSRESIQLLRRLKLKKTMLLVLRNAFRTSYLVLNSIVEF